MISVKPTENLKVTLGVTENNKKVEFNFNNQNSLYMCGSTGTGKSTLIKNIVKELINKNKQNLQIVFVDIKITEFGDYQNSEYAYKNKVYTKLSEIELLLEELCKIVDERTLKVKEGNVNNLPNIVFVVDEIADILYDKKANVINNLVKICGSQNINIYSVISTQRANLMPQELFDVINTKMCFHYYGGLFPNQFVDYEIINDLQVGEAIVKNKNDEVIKIKVNIKN